MKPATPVAGQSLLAWRATPVSFNAGNHRASQWKFAKEKREWQQRFTTLLIAAGTPRCCRSMSATAVLTFPFQRRRDELNFRTVLDKSLGDALVAGLWIPDDTTDYFRFGEINFVVVPGKRLTEVTLEWAK